jgi:serine/threonine protein kinase
MGLRASSYNFSHVGYSSLILAVPLLRIFRCEESLLAHKILPPVLMFKYVTTGGGGGGVTEYEMLTKIGKGASSEVMKGQCIRTKKYVAIKCMRHNFNNINKVNHYFMIYQ